MYIKLQQAVRLLLLPFSRISEKCGERGRSALVTGGLLGMIFQELAVEFGLVPDRYLVTFLWKCLFLGLIFLGGLAPGPNPARVSKPLLVCWLGICCSILLTMAFFPRKSYVASLLFWLAICPAIWLAWGGRRFRRMPLPLIRAEAAAFAVSMALCALFFPIETESYGGFFLNRNSLGAFCAAAFACFLAYALSKERFSIRVLLADLGMGIGFAVTYYSSCRSGMLAMAVCFVFTSLLQLLLHKREWTRILVRRILPAAAAVLVMLPSAIYLFHGAHAAASQILALTAPPSTSTEEPLPGTEPGLTPKPSAGQMMETIKDYNEQRISTGEKTLDDFSSGRADIWAAFAREVGLLGNPPEKVVYDPVGEPITIGSHLTVLQMAYSNGILAGIFFLLLNILGGLKSIRYAFKYPGKLWSLFPFAVIITYGVISLLENLSDLMRLPVSILYFFVQAPLLLDALPSDEDAAEAVP